jgi:hypothetical protein
VIMLRRFSSCTGTEQGGIRSKATEEKVCDTNLYLTAEMQRSYKQTIFEQTSPYAQVTTANSRYILNNLQQVFIIQ